jgi:8-oxo-dGTP pyrophosphatase MutT (NUDIX family)
MGHRDVNDPAQAVPRPAATLILVRAGNALPEILLLKRMANSRFMPNAHVFAGGAVDAADRSAASYAACAGIDDLGASRRLGLPADGLQYFVAAIRESFEESGLVMAYEAPDRFVDFSAWTEQSVQALRASVNAGETDLATLCGSHGWRLAADEISYYSHWITPAGLPRRYDTRFFIGRAPPGQRASVANAANGEMSELIWRTAADALSDHKAGRLLLMKATHTLLQEISTFGDMDALFAVARSQRDIRPVMPVMPGPPRGGGSS